MALPIVALQNVSKRYVLHHERSRSFQEAVVDVFSRRDRRREEFWALRDITFEVGPGESVGLIGANGSGKSTTLKLIARIMEPSSGQLMVRGRVGALLELGAGFHPDLSGRENIYLSGSILGLSRAQVNHHLDAIIAFADIGQFIDVPVRLYSSGMFVRLGFSVAVHLDTEVLLIDEVLAVGDAAFQRRCYDKLEALQAEGRTLIVVSHDLNAIWQLCTRVLQFDQGRIRLQGTTDEVVRTLIDRQADAASSGSGLVDGVPTRLHLVKSEMGEAVMAALDGGWYEPEDTHCWMTRRAGVNLHVPAGASHAYFELASMRPRDGERPLPLRIAFDGGPAETIYLTHPNWQIVRVKLPPQVRGRRVHTTLEVERTQVPDLILGNGDTRELGVAVSRIWTE
jgi:ABC-type polysaccharide/polyol phosphate transport system ATPase subunit